jgi:Peptidase M15
MKMTTIASASDNLGNFMSLPVSAVVFAGAPLSSKLGEAALALSNAKTPVEAGAALRAMDSANGLPGNAASLVGTIAIDRSSNRDGSVTVERSRILEARDITIQTPQGPVRFPLVTRRDPMGSIRLLPQQTANGAPATPTPAMEQRLLNFSQLIGQEVSVSSGIRTVAQQASLRGNNPNTVASVSQHNVGDAADIAVSGISGRALAQRAVASGLLERVNLYPTGAVHVDQRDVGAGTQYYENWQRRH